MKRAMSAAALLAMLLSAPPPTVAASAVFSGDPIDPATGLPYEILPGFPLVQPGADGLLGTADDVSNPSVIGDIDLVVRSGSLSATDILPPPTLQAGRGVLPIGVAGSSAGGGSDIAFTVFLSDGAISNAAPAGHLLAAADMDGLPVIVAAFADLDGDGFIGPTDRDRAGAADNSLEVRELDPVGRGVALFTAGVARGRVAVRAGLPASQGGLMVALTALAATGPFDPNFFGGSVPSGPAISTAMPFLPQRDLTRLIRDRAVSVGPTTTVQQVIAFAALPDPHAAFAVPLDGGAVTVDAAVVNSQPVSGVAFREDLAGAALQRPVDDLLLGTRRPANTRRLRLVAVDRWGNAADPAPSSTVTLRATPPLRVVSPRGRTLTPRHGDGLRVSIKVPSGAADGATGTLTAERDGVVVAALSYRVDAGANRPGADVRVPSRQATTVQAAIDAATDRNRDGTVVIDIEPGIYRENVVVNRAVVLRGADAATTIVQGDGSASAVAVSAANVTIRGLTAVGGGTGFALAGSAALLAESSAWRNVNAGVSVSGAGARVWRTASIDNGGDGVNVSGADGAACSESYLLDNRGAGLGLSSVQNAQVDNNLIAANAGDGVSLTSVSSTIVSDNQSANNLLAGMQLMASQSNQIVGNLSTLNDGDGLHLESTSDNLISGNDFDSNNGYGAYVRRSTNDDFAVAPGLQAPPGDNDSRSNRKGDVLVR